MLASGASSDDAEETTAARSSAERLEKEATVSELSLEEWPLLIASSLFPTGAHPISGSGGTIRKPSFWEKQIRHCGVRVQSGTKTPLSINLAKGVAASGEPQLGP